MGMIVGEDNIGNYIIPKTSSSRIYLPKQILPSPISKRSTCSAPVGVFQDYSSVGSATNSQVHQYVSQKGSVLLGTNVFNGSTNPKWRDQIRNGQNATTNANGTLYYFENEWLDHKASGDSTLPPPQDRHVSEAFSGFLTLSFSGTNPISSDDLTAVTNRAISKFLAAIDSVQSSIEAGQDFGEYKESLRGLVSPLDSLKKHTLGYFDSLKKVKKFRGPSLRKAIADTYLEWTFGWKPLVSDIADAYVGLTSNSHPITAPVEAGASVDYTANEQFWNVAGELPSTFCSYSGKIRATAKYQVRFKGSVRTGARDNGQFGLGKVLQVDLPHFIPTVWDLLPYSFIVDYFANVGDIIRAASFIESDLIWCCRTDRTVEKNSFVLSQTAQDLGPWFKGSYSAATCNPKVMRVKFTRTPFPPRGLVPVLQFHLPHSVKPWENIGAILASRAKAFNRWLT